MILAPTLLFVQATFAFVIALVRADRQIFGTFKRTSLPLSAILISWNARFNGVSFAIWTY